MDVGPNPVNRICRGCGIQNPGEDHNHGRGHLTEDKVCKARYKTPYVVRKRKWKRKSLAYDESSRTSPRPQDPPAAPEPSPPHRKRQSRLSLFKGRGKPKEQWLLLDTGFQDVITRRRNQGSQAEPPTVPQQPEPTLQTIM
ncbi:hypothetical protein HPB48_013944 [Haemaphysalis longicornis]|uniref:Uncharacterized protein n=1 Tax=Haemaphysalis longicornis TaxID=44386 RepID=A0A9J6H0C6_HAELO|nr:hypothetical protein HPB48_013944 [Haemaphysalis longicornis]